MNENAVKIQIAEAALEKVKVPATEENVNTLQVIWQMLRQVKGDLLQQAPAGAVEEINVNAGEAEKGPLDP